MKAYQLGILLLLFISSSKGYYENIAEINEQDKYQQRGLSKEVLVQLLKDIESYKQSMR